MTRHWIFRLVWMLTKLQNACILSMCDGWTGVSRVINNRIFPPVNWWMLTPPHVKVVCNALWYRIQNCTMENTNSWLVNASSRLISDAPYPPDAWRRHYCYNHWFTTWKHKIVQWSINGASFWISHLPHSWCLTLQLLTTSNHKIAHWSLNIAFFWISPLLHGRCLTQALLLQSPIYNTRSSNDARITNSKWSHLSAR